MNDEMDFNDPAFVARVQSWAAERQSMDRAPSRLVDAVMDGVAAAPRRTPWLARLPLRGAAGYAALTVAITVGVTFGILLAGRLTPNVGDRSPSPSIASPEISPSAPAQSSPVASPSVLARLSDVPIGATAIGALRDSIWVASRDNELAELDPVTGDVVRSVGLPRQAHGLLVTDDAVWASSRDGDLVRVARLDLAIVEVPGAVGGALVQGDGVVWLGGGDEVLRIDTAANNIGLRVPVPNRGPEHGIAVDGASVWVATQTEIQRLDAATGSVTASIPGDATSLLVLDGTLWATRGTELLRIDSAAAQVLEFIPGIPAGAATGSASGVLWLATGGGPGRLEGWDLTAPHPVAIAALPEGAVGVALTSDTIWIASDVPGAVFRFRLP